MTCSNVNFAADGAALLAMFAVLFQLVSLILFYDARGLHGLCVSVLQTMFTLHHLLCTVLHSDAPCVLSDN